MGDSRPEATLGMRSRGEEATTARARARTPPAPARDGWGDATVGVDLGGTKIALGVVDRAGKVLDSDRIPTRAGRPAAEVIDDIVTAVRDRWNGKLSRASPLGIGVAGQIGPDGSVIFGPNLDWHDVPLGTRLHDALGRPISVLNDVQAATYGEWKHGAGRGTDDLVCVFVGTGVGGGIVAGGRLRQGPTGTAGEVGHLTVVHNGRKCRCPNSGCLEAYAGGWAIAQRAQEAVAADPARGESLRKLADGVGAITSETVEEGYLAGDPLARELVQETTGYLAAGLVSIVNALDPSAIVLGGGVLAGYPSLVGELGREVRRRALPAAVQGLRIVAAALGAESGVVGAAAFAREATPG
jgi:glucokinase